MPFAYRLCKSRYAPSSLENALRAGDGAARAGGRWNRPGTSAVYTSGSIALAVLEILVHSPLELPDGYELWKVELPLRCAKIEELPRDPAGAQELGDRWLSGSSVVEVPSVVIPQESNYILNPKHLEYPAGHWTPMGTFDFDYRLRPHLKAFVTHEG